MFKKYFERLKRKRMLDVQSFAHANRSMFVIVCDPRDDTMFVSYRDKQVAGRISSMDGKNHKVVKNMLKHSTFEREIDRFIGSLIDVLKCPIKEGNPFYQFIDGATFAIANALNRNKKQSYAKSKEDGGDTGSSDAGSETGDGIARS